ncbi:MULTISPECIES: maleylpyruvate isomerase family mycothiol-dependent enzyme [unclassified Streptomyces]|uniref:maleylpyruvate isomerase family mycothiol-dependent enzyme n=1 Tax=unclassified Streptomyces TaxID=2593676 RepID=UPI00081B5E13|nr:MULTISPECIES: maleylpyruvate isomerase family mycothiol-dependent enzyme [unclassified Streptomyces]MYQ85624.1 maleylpyruvate isomerase family mycothiol-dependent enzyme [Streptomyces sp. SID4936]SCE07935.1 TIGR03083 family protein [Streptomyces sp. DvalAA-43]
MSRLSHDLYCDEIIARTDALRATIRGADLGATVPSCPDWTLRELAVHVGGAHRWVGEIVRTRATGAISPDQVPESTPGSDDPATLDAWLAEGAARTVEALRAAGPDEEVWSWAWEGSTGFWARRMAHETIVHHADAALTARTGYEVAPELAADTIEEWLEIVAFVRAAGDKRAAELTGGAGGSIHLHATDAPGAEWLIEFGEDGFAWRRSHEKAAVSLRGSLTDIMLVFNRRLAADGDRVEVLGDTELLDFWLEHTVFG